MKLDEIIRNFGEGDLAPVGSNCSWTGRIDYFIIIIQL